MDKKMKNNKKNYKYQIQVMKTKRIMHKKIKKNKVM